MHIINNNIITTSSINRLNLPRNELIRFKYLQFNKGFTFTFRNEYDSKSVQV